MQNKPGIYAIVNHTNGRIYIGRSNRVSSRISNHRHYLRKSQHACHELQADWDAGDNITFEVQEYCSVEELASAEQSWLNKLRAAGVNLYNKNRVISTNSSHSQLQEILESLVDDRAVNVFIINCS